MARGSIQAWLLVAGVVGVWGLLVSRLSFSSAPLLLPHIAMPLLFVVAFAVCAIGPFISSSSSSYGRHVQVAQAGVALGLYFSAPWELCAAFLGGSLASSLLFRLPLIEVVFNTFHLGIAIVLGIFIVSRSVNPQDPFSTRSLLGLTAALLVAPPLSLLSIALHALYSQSLNWSQIFRRLLFLNRDLVVGSVVGICATILLGIGIYPFSLGLISAATFIVFLRNFNARKAQQAQLDEMHALTTSLLTATDLSRGAGNYLLRVCRLFNATTAVLELYTNTVSGTIVHSTTVSESKVVGEGLEGSPSPLTTSLLANLKEREYEIILSAADTGPWEELVKKYNISTGVICRLGPQHHPLGLLLITASASQAKSLQKQAAFLMSQLAAQTRVAFERSLLVTSLESMVQARLAAEQKALHDSLTGLANRELFCQKADEALLSANASSRVAILFIDLDGFKKVNDTYGHAGGDQVLLSVSHRLEELLRSHDTAARFGGDEFAVVLTKLPSVAAAQIVAGRILEAIRRPISLHNGTGYVKASIGICGAPLPPCSRDKLMQWADAAMYEAKRKGKDCFVVANLAENPSHE